MRTLKNYCLLAFAVLFLLTGLTYAQCIANFSSTSFGTTVSFSNASIGGSFYTWDFGDGSSGTGFNPTHTYPSSGLYWACLTVLDTFGAPCGTFCDTVFVGGGGAVFCTASFSSSVSGSTATFSNFSSGVTYLWNFGDGATSTAWSPSHTYSGTGWYLVCLTAFDSLGIACATNCDSLYISGGSACTAYYTYSVTGTTASFYNWSSVGTYVWDFGGGATSTTWSPSYTFPGPGVYPVCVTVYDSGVACATYCDSVTIAGCTSAFYAYADSTPLLGSLTWYFSAVGTSGYSYVWDFGDGSTGSGMYATHTYSDTGYYAACLSVYDSIGTLCSSTCDTIGVFLSPTTGLSSSLFTSGRLSVYPNPVRDASVSISIGTGLEVQNIKVTDLSGRILIETDVLRPGSHMLDISALSSGLYFVVAETSEGISQTKLVKE